MRYLLLSIILLFSCKALYAQNATLEGYVLLDYDSNCFDTPGDRPLSDIVLEAKDSLGNRYYAATSLFSGGLYSFSLPPGFYEVSANLPFDHPYGNFCQTSQNILLGPSQFDTLIFLVQPNSAQALIHTDFAAANTPSCAQTHFRLYCQNVGTAVATNTVVQLTMDSIWTLDSTSYLFTPLGNNQYQFPINSLFVGRDSSLTIDIWASPACTSSVPSQAFRFKTEVLTPSTLFNTGYLGPVLESHAECVGDSILFRIQNKGINDAAPRSFTIIEDDLMYSEPVIGPLDTLTEDSIWVAALAGSTYRIEGFQDSLMPAIYSGPLTWASIEGCKDSAGLFNTGFITPFYTEDASPLRDFYISRANDNPTFNNIWTQLEGYGANHYILANIPIEYQIRFQNNSNNNISSVTILDSIPSTLDLSSLILGAASHDFYNFSIRDGNAVVIEFFGINLLPGEVGYINLNFNQTLNNPPGTVIENRAEIIFDGTDTLLTPMVFHTIGTDFIQVISDMELAQPQTATKVFPNPAVDQVTFEVDSWNFESLSLEIFTVQGQLVFSKQEHNNNQIRFDRLPNLRSGLYYYQLKGDGQWLDSGKIFLK